MKNLLNRDITYLGQLHIASVKHQPQGSKILPKRKNTTQHGYDLCCEIWNGQNNT